MTRSMIVPLLFGLIGAAVLIALGNWQLQRLEWKQDILAEIDARIQDAPGALPNQPDPARDKYMPVRLDGEIGEGEVHVLVSRKQIGPGFRIVAPMQVGDRRVLLDRGFVRSEDKDRPRPPKPLVVEGNLHWPDDRNSSTPANDIARNFWFARDIDEMAAVLGTEPILVIARSDTGDGVDPMPLDSSGITNDHLQYAITWFSLAVVWLGMTAFLLWRIKRRNA